MPGVTGFGPEQAQAVLRDLQAVIMLLEGMAKTQQATVPPNLQPYPIQKITEIYNKITEMYKKVTELELEISSWNVLFLLRSEVAYIGTGPILP